MRIKRHEVLVRYLERGMRQRGWEVEVEPHIPTDEGLRKRDLIARKANEPAIVIDALVVGTGTDLRSPPAEGCILWG